MRGETTDVIDGRNNQEQTGTNRKWNNRNFFVLNLFRRNLGLVFTLVSDSLAGTRDSSYCPVFSFGKVWPNNGFLLTGLMHPPSEKPIYNHITDRAKCNFFQIKID